MTDNAPLQSAGAPSVDEAARRWFTHLRGDVAQETKADFEAWLRCAPDHAWAYNQIEQAFAQAEILKASALYGTGRPQRSVEFPRHRAWITGIAAIAATLVIVLLRHGSNPATSPLDPLARHVMALTTRHGEIRSERLADGSQVTLDTDSRIELAINGDERRIHLTRGHIRLAVDKGAHPFRVDAGAGAVTAPIDSEASFDIGYDGGQQVRVDMISGQTEVHPHFHMATWTVPVATLDAGQSLGWSEQGLSRLTAIGTAQRIDATQWPTGWVSYQTVPLEELVAQANHYADRPITLDGPAIGKMAISGRFHISAPASLAHNLADVFGLRLDNTSSAVHLRQK